MANDKEIIKATLTNAAAVLTAAYIAKHTAAKAETEAQVVATFKKMLRELSKE
jgi:hypothetical protein